VIVAGFPKDAKRNTIGRSPWVWATSGATNQKIVSNWAFKRWRLKREKNIKK
jgi:hypothetical protein